MSATSAGEQLSAMCGTTQEKRELVRRVVASATFSKSRRLSSFLACICELTLAGRAAEINEQKIGTAVFGRAPDYDSSVDGIVRPQASRLRQRLDFFFSVEGASEPVRITLPRGTYVPVFEPNVPSTLPADPLQVVSSVVSSPALPHEQTRVAPRSGRLLPWALISAFAVLFLLVGMWAWRDLIDAPARAPKSGDAALWGFLFRRNQSTIVVPGDTGFVLWQAATRKAAGLPQYLSGSYREQSSGDDPAGAMNSSDLASRRYTSIVDLGIVKQLTQVADTAQHTLAVTYARDLGVADLKESNVILLGASASNPWVELFEPQLNFVFSDARIRQYTIVNRSPNGGEPSSWTAKYDDPAHLVYCEVAFLPNLSGRGSVLILEGTSMAGTQCAWDFVASDSSFSAFAQKLPRTNGALPHFEVVLQSTNLTGSAGKTSVLAWRPVR